MSRPNVYSIAAQAPFIPTLVEAVLHDQLGLGVDFIADPLKLADLTIFVPTQRAAKMLSTAFAQAFTGRATFLPRILPLGGLGQDEEAFAPANELGDVVLISDTDRRLVLTQLVLHWGEALREAVRSIGPDGQRQLREPNEVFVAVKNPADAWVLAGQLAALMDETRIEGIDWAKFQRLGQGSYDDYWRITLDFLKIAFEQWPNILSSRGQIDTMQHRADLIGAEILRLSKPRGPVIAAGSTGTNAATARLLQAIATAPQGALVLPGLDFDLDKDSWDLLVTDTKLASHPQAVLARLVQRLEVPRADIVPLGLDLNERALRVRFASEALRPAQTTAQWAQTPWPQADLAQALAGVALIEAENEREEALAIALVLREAIEVPGHTAALITPERTLAQRVAGELGRWGIEVEDSSGQSLSRAKAGALAQIVLEAARASGAVSLLALLTHPLCGLGRGRQALAPLVAQLEIAVLRQMDVRLYTNFDDALSEAQALALGPHAPGFLAGLTTTDWDALRQLSAQCAAALEPLRALPPKTPLKDWAGAHLASLQLIAALPEAQTGLSGRDGQALVALLQEMIDSADATLLVDDMEYAQFFGQSAREKPVRLFGAGHPRIAILGLLEARLMSADLVVLAGCDEKIWPPQGQTDALLNRSMREELGLSSPERRLGQTAHDFVMGFAQPRVIMTRARKRGGEPTVASRFLQRMDALAGAAFEICRTEGTKTLALARVLDRATPQSLPRPMPRPALDLRPKKLSVTKVETLRRDPYALYAEQILRFPVLNPLEPDLTARDFGTRTHKIFERFALLAPGSALPPDAGERLLGFAREAFALIWDNPIFQTFDRVKIERMLAQFLDWERMRRSNITKIHAEIRGEHHFTLNDGSPFRLSAEADRLEIGPGGSVTLFDFKTGAFPSVKQVLVGFAPQLTLEAYLAQIGAFPEVEPTRQVAASYVKFGHRDGMEERKAAGKDGDLAQLALDHFGFLVGLLEQFRRPETAYVPRPFPQFASKFNPYDHLSRHSEWDSIESDGEAEA